MLAENCSSQLIHEPIELPLSIEVFLSRLSDAPDVGFILVSQFLDTRPQACLEAVIERCISILDNSMKGGRKKKIRKSV